MGNRLSMIPDKFVDHLQRMELLKFTKKVYVKMNTKAVRKKAKKGFFKSMAHAAAAIRLTARRSVRTGTPKKKEVPLQFYTPTGRNLGSLGYEMTVADRKPSQPGQAPKSWMPKRYLKESILYEVDERNECARIYINPKFDSKDIWKRHEIGGIFETHYRERYYIVGKPFENSQRRSEEFRKQTRIWYRRSAVKTKMGNYPKRPFLAPALEKMKPRIPAMWKNALHI